MKSMNRQFGKLLVKGAGDTAKVSVLIADYEDADKTLTKIIEASKGWRDAWVSILSSQLATISGFEELYNPILGTTDSAAHDPAITPQLQLDRTARLKETYAELKTDLLEEVIMMDARVIKPATDAKDYIQPIRKTIKKRDNKRLDWERYIDKVNHASKKMKRTDRENAALAKAEEELAKAADDFKVADDHLRETLPPIISAAFAILPHLLSVQIMIQNTLLAQYYTALHNYCDEAGFPSPPPPMDDVITTWERNFKPVQKEVETINVIARGKAVHSSMSLGNDGTRKNSSITGLNVRNGFATRRASSQGLSTLASSQARVMRIPSSSSIHAAPEPSPSPEPEYGTHLTPASSYSSHAAGGPTGDYFQRGVGQKKKPPPPPPKRIGSQGSGLFAVALYAFKGEGQGDLSFQEGDKIKVVKKTDSTDDWWEGELMGVRGSFPANYCKLA
ncbi:Regulator of cytoskeleton and endocytosis [Hyphodiscus hymeniophilus]|uniref:Regulator of cytoskeleton and endocytosis n=1 Tax=Hyphodiscus hymeniophilus TaxID=353542 RepID=A0A9P6VLA5_9HELO|nr:Regulator of cytoskeleton and endocytosis [Hyphodiscus hymeniophilus]